jgi:hypothetical protein
MASFVAKAAVVPLLLHPTSFEAQLAKPGLLMLRLGAHGGKDLGKMRTRRSAADDGRLRKERVEASDSKELRLPWSNGLDAFALRGW